MLDNTQTAARILIIDDQPANTLLLEGILEEDDYQAHRSITDSRKALPVFLEYRPDFTLLDLGHLRGGGQANVTVEAPALSVAVFFAIIPGTALGKLSIPKPLQAN